jgi:protein-L-isoaspartate(D-aspartate) O-methyltransferase
MEYNISAMNGEEEKLALARQRMVDDQLRCRGIVDGDVLKAFEMVPRHHFVPSAKVNDAYADHPLPIGYGQTISQPFVVALMLQELDVQPHHRILEIGAGSGYQTALLARLAAQVYAIERIDQLAERALTALGMLNVSNVTLRAADGSLGWPEEAPFDRIICGAGAPDVPSPWAQQLVDGGRIVLPVGGRDLQTIVIVERKGEQTIKRETCNVCFVKLIGEEGWPA